MIQSIELGEETLSQQGRPARCRVVFKAPGQTLEFVFIPSGILNDKPWRPSLLSRVWIEKE